MNWDAIGAIGEIIGAIAVVATLFYLAVQIRQNNRVVEENSRQLRLGEVDATLQSFSRFRGLIVNPDTAALLTRGLADYASLEEAEQIQVGAVLDEYMFSYWSVFQRMREGAYSEEDWHVHLKALAAMMSRSGAKQWWAQRKSNYPVKFVAYLDDYLNRPGE